MVSATQSTQQPEIAERQGHAARSRLALVATATAAIATIALFEGWSRHALSDLNEAPPTSVRAQNVVVLPKLVGNLAPAPAAPQVLLMGNSHTYALPGLHKGEPLQPDPGVTLVDQLARFASDGHPTRSGASFLRLSYPNFLPFEMLARSAQLLGHGYNPRLAVIGLTWRNIGRDTHVRRDIELLFHDADFVRSFEAELARPGVDPERVLQPAIDGEVRQARFESESVRTRSDADRFDDALSAWVGKRVTLNGHSAELRARMYRSFAYAVDDLLARRNATEYSYDVSDDDLRFNLACLRAMLRMFRAHGTHIVVYLAPERTDLPPLADPKLEDRVMGEWLAHAAAEGVIVLDARHVVPNQYWGWERETPDRSHFREPGHELLGRFLAEGIERAGGWSVIE